MSFTQIIKEVLEKDGIEIDYESCEAKSLKIGRNGLAQTAGIVSLEVSAFNKNRPTLAKISGLKFEEGKYAYNKEEVRYRSDLSNGGNGTRSFLIEDFAIYEASDVLWSGGRRGKQLFIYIDDAVFSLESYTSILKAVFPSDIARIERERAVIKASADRADQIVSAVEQERSMYKDEVIDGITATPEFECEITRDDALRAIKNEQDIDEFIALRSTPARYVVSEPVFAKAESAEEAVAQAQAIIAERAESAEKAAALSSDLGLPDLSGTPRQIAWAIQIRAKAASNGASISALKRATTAKYWIDRRFDY